MNLPYNPNHQIIVVCGHFGAGKTNISVALALSLKDAGKDITLIDLDIINPYFRAADAERLLKDHGIRCINPQFANTNVDVPSIGPEVASAFVDVRRSKNSIVIFDVGGDNGAAALGKYKKDFDEIGYDMLCVVNKYRPLTETPELALDGIKEIEYYSRLNFTHLVNNSNIGSETTVGYISDSLPYIDKLSQISALPIAFTAINDENNFKATLEQFPERKLFKINDTTRKIF